MQVGAEAPLGVELVCMLDPPRQLFSAPEAAVCSVEISPMQHFAPNFPSRSAK
jgi:hypothetical protein